MKAVVFAYHDMGCAGIQSLLDAGYDIAAIFTHPDNPGENHFFGSVARIAAEQGIPVWAPEDVNHPLWIERIREIKPDVLFSFYYRNLLCDDILNIAPGAFNLHGSLLPKYRGRAPLNWVLVNGESETGVTLHRMVNRADAGNIVAQKSVAIGANDAALALHRKLCAAASDLLAQALPAIRDGKTEERVGMKAGDLRRSPYAGRRSPRLGTFGPDAAQPRPRGFRSVAGRVRLRRRKQVYRLEITRAPRSGRRQSGDGALRCAAGRRLSGRGVRNRYRADRARRLYAGYPAGAGAGHSCRRGAEQQTGGGD